MNLKTTMNTFGRSVTRTPRRRELGHGRVSRPFSARPARTNEIMRMKKKVVLL